MDPYTASMLGQSLGSGIEMIGGFFGDRKAAKKADERYEMSRDALLRQIGNTRVAYGNIGDLLKQNLKGVNQGFGKARSLLGGAGTSARNLATQQGQQNLAGLAQNMASRGLGGTTVLDNAQRGIYSDTSRRLAEIDEWQGGQMANLELGRMSALGGARGDLANFYAQKDQAEISNRSDLISLWLNTIPGAKNSMAGASKLGGQSALALNGLFGG